jgi:hypothetical protein
MSEEHPGEAASLLARADRLAAQVNRHSRWYASYLAIFGTAALVTVPLVGLGDRMVGAIAMAFWGAVMVALWFFAARQPVNRRGFARRHGRMIGLWAVAYAIVVAVGISSFPDDPGWWIPGGVIVSLPAFILACREIRS